MTKTRTHIPRPPVPLVSTLLTALLLATALTLTSASHTARAEDRQLQIIALQHRPAELLLPALQAVASPDSQITASGHQLIIRATAAETAQLRLLIDELDQPLAQFRISVRQRGSHSSQQRGVEASGQVGSGNLSVGRTRLDGTPLPPASGSLTAGKQGAGQVTVIRRSSAGGDNITQQLRTVEGYPAYIETGSEIPYLSGYYYQPPNRGSAYGGAAIEQRYKPVVTGFYVTPDRSGEDQVRLTLSTTKQSLDDRQQATVNTAGYQSTLRVPLGQWIDLGSHLAGDSQRNQSIGRRHSVNSEESLQLQVKVELLP